ncbi:MAG: RNA polymerase sigma factor [Chitinophagaceae bacterium]|nr:RNA polymerase sigma factor [Chitinophagaceae bacterium]
MESNFASSDQLIELLYEYDPEAYSLLYDTYSASIHGNILELISNKDIAEDVLIEVFKTAYRTIRTFDRTKSSLYVWLFHLAQSHCYSIMRAIKSWPSAEEFAKTEGSVRKILSNLPPGPRHAMELHYFRGYTNRQIANHLHIPLETVKELLGVARQHMGAYLKEQRSSQT